MRGCPGREGSNAWLGDDWLEGPLPEPRATAHLGLPPATQLPPSWPRLIIRNGDNVEAPPVYDSYEVEYLPIEGLLSSNRHFFVELSTDSSGAAAGMALRYEGELVGTQYGGVSRSGTSLFPLHPPHLHHPFHTSPYACGT